MEEAKKTTDGIAFTVGVMGVGLILAALAGDWRVAAVVIGGWFLWIAAVYYRTEQNSK